ncbi:DUF5677 domain-containing protein [Pseudoalteromonas piscicida]|uniref:DUF5677 domain-containing protein n=1 Tax=Pseudoalteromonas piscicida TaxID=43662 RepID=UPI001C960BCF|nr:DUF5677 domain-containing protein [Pseudoalteromonas piscicida]QZO15654.1 DUF5677 domain-containing protein [Pseudoalteromonas piscicida]
MPKKLKDHVVEGSNLELKKNIDKIIKKSKFISRWIDKNVDRTEKSALLVNILNSLGDYLEVTKLSINQHISVLALSTRSIYELNVRLRTLSNEEEQKKWASEAVTDKVQTLEGILSLSGENENMQQRMILESEILRLKQLVAKHNLPNIKQPASTGNLAKTVDLESEHKGLFKLYSKLVHPSSYLVNDYTNSASVENQKILQIHAQLYAHDSVSRICEELNIPYEVSKPYGKA